MMSGKKTVKRKKDEDKIVRPKSKNKEKTYKNQSKPIKTYHAHITVVVAFSVVNFFDFRAITRHHEGRFI